jgi:succinate dehydrogenase cytochrome b subunit
MATRNRPLSPHLGIYKWQLHMAMSILHRATGTFLAFGLVVFAWWLMAIAAGPDQLASFMALAVHPVGRLALLGISYSLIYHALNGVRHLFWDAGRGYDLDTVRNSGLLVMAASVAFTLVLWMFVYGMI